MSDGVELVVDELSIVIITVTVMITMDSSSTTSSTPSLIGLVGSWCISVEYYCYYTTGCYYFYSYYCNTLQNIEQETLRKRKVFW